jgi:hypothetical protein
MVADCGQAKHAGSRWENIDSELKIIRIVQAKGRKDRHVMLPPEMLDLLHLARNGGPKRGRRRQRRAFRDCGKDAGCDLFQHAGLYWSAHLERFTFRRKRIRHFEVVFTLGGSDGCDEGADVGAGVLDGALLGTPHPMLDLGEGLLGSRTGASCCST